MITLTTQLGGCELDLSSRQNDAQTSSVVKYNGRCIDILPNEMLDNIFSFLGLQDVSNCRCVSRRWKKVIDDYQIMPYAFCRRFQFQKHSLNAYNVELYDSSTKGWLNKFGDEGKKAIMPLDQHLKSKLFPQILFWSIAQVLGRTKAFCCESILTIEHADSVIKSCFSPDGKQITTFYNDKTAKIYDLIDKEWQEKTIIERSSWDNNAFLCLSADGKHMLKAFNSNTAKIYKLIDGDWQEKATIKHNLPVNSACFSADAKHIVTASCDYTAKIYKLIDNEWQEKDTIKHDHPVNSACFSADAKHVVTASDDNTAKIYGVGSDEHWQEKATIKHNDKVKNACFSGDGKHVVTASNDKTAKIYGVSSDEHWQEKATIQHDDIVRNACFSPDAKHVVTASNDKTAKIYGLNHRQWQEKATIKHGGGVKSACFGPDGKYVMTTSVLTDYSSSKFVTNVYMLIDKKSKDIS